MKQELSQLVLVATVELDYVQRMASLCMRWKNQDSFIVGEHVQGDCLNLTSLYSKQT